MKNGSSKPVKRQPNTVLKLPIKRLGSNTEQSNLDSQPCCSPLFKAEQKTLRHNNLDKNNNTHNSPIMTSSGGIKLPIKPSKFTLNSIRPIGQLKTVSIDSEANKNQNIALNTNCSVLSKSKQRSKTPDLKIKKQTLSRNNKSSKFNLSKEGSNTDDSTIGCSIEKGIGLKNDNNHFSNEDNDKSSSSNSNLDINKNKAGLKNLDKDAFSPETSNTDLKNKEDELSRLNNSAVVDIEIKRKTLRRRPGKR